MSEKRLKAGVIAGLVAFVVACGGSDKADDTSNPTGVDITGSVDDPVVDGTDQQQNPNTACSVFRSYSTVTTQRPIIDFTKGVDGTIYFTSFGQEKLWSVNPASNNPVMQLIENQGSVNTDVIGDNKDVVYFMEDAGLRGTHRIRQYDLASGSAVTVSPQDSWLVESATVVGDAVYYGISTNGVDLWSYDPVSKNQQITSDIQVDNIMAGDDFVYFTAYFSGNVDNTRLYRYDAGSGSVQLLHTTFSYIADLKPVARGGAVAQTGEGTIQIDAAGQLSTSSLSGELITAVDQFATVVRRNASNNWDVVRAGPDGGIETLGTFNNNLLQWSELEVIGENAFITAHIDGSFAIVRVRQGEAPVVISADQGITTGAEMLVADNKLYFSGRQNDEWSLWSYDPFCENVD